MQLIEIDSRAFGPFPPEGGNNFLMKWVAPVVSNGL